MPASVSILGGKDKHGNPEPITRLTLESGKVYSIVGLTGSGKSQLISDIEQMAQRDTVTSRQVLLDNEVPPHSVRYSPAQKLVAHLSQNMNFALEMTVRDFVLLHAECRRVAIHEYLVDEVLAMANELTGESVLHDDILTRLSGGQSRALMIADVAMISKSPIVLIDEVENAGIDREKAMEMLAVRGKMVLIVTHDPQLALLGVKRIVMENGAMTRVMDISDAEREAARVLSDMSRMVLVAQKRIRSGERLQPSDLVVEERVLG